MELFSILAALGFWVSLAMASTNLRSPALKNLWALLCIPATLNAVLSIFGGPIPPRYHTSALFEFPMALANSTAGPRLGEHATKATMRDEYDLWHHEYRHEASHFRTDPFIEYHGGFPWIMGIVWVVLVVMAVAQICFFLKLNRDLRIAQTTPADECRSTRTTHRARHVPKKRNQVVFGFEYSNSTLAVEHGKLTGQLNTILPEFRSLQHGVSVSRDSITVLETRVASILTELDALKTLFRDTDLEDRVMSLQNQIDKIEEWKQLQEASTLANQVDEDTIKRTIGHMNLASKDSVHEDISRVKSELDKFKELTVAREDCEQTNHEVSQIKSTLHPETWKTIRHELQSELKNVRTDLRNAKRNFVTDDMLAFLTGVLQGKASARGVNGLEPFQTEQPEEEKVSIPELEDIKSKYDGLELSHNKLVAKVEELDEKFTLRSSYDELKNGVECLNTYVHSSREELDSSLGTVNDIEKRLAASVGRIGKWEKGQETLSSKREAIEEKAASQPAKEKELMGELQSRTAKLKIEGEIGRMSRMEETIKAMKFDDITEDLRREIEKVEKGRQTLSNKLEGFEKESRILAKELGEKKAPSPAGETDLLVLDDKIKKLSGRFNETNKELNDALSRLDFLSNEKMLAIEKEIWRLDLDVNYYHEHEIECCVKKENPEKRGAMPQRLRVKQDELDKREGKNTELLHGSANIQVTLAGDNKGGESSVSSTHPKKSNTPSTFINRPENRSKHADYAPDDKTPKKQANESPGPTIGAAKGQAVRKPVIMNLNAGSPGVPGNTAPPKPKSSGLEVSKWATGKNDEAKTAKPVPPKQQGNISTHTPSTSDALKPEETAERANASFTLASHAPEPEVKEDGANTSSPSPSEPQDEQEHSDIGSPSTSNTQQHGANGNTAYPSTPNGGNKRGNKNKGRGGRNNRGRNKNTHVFYGA